MWKINPKLENLALVLHEVQMVCAQYKKLQKLISNDSRVHLIQRLQEFRALMKARIKQLDQFYVEHSTDYRVKFVTMIKFELLKTISPLHQLNKIVHNSSLKDKLYLPIQKSLTPKKSLIPLKTNKSIQKSPKFYQATVARKQQKSPKTNKKQNIEKQSARIQNLKVSTSIRNEQSLEQISNRKKMQSHQNSKLKSAQELKERMKESNLKDIHNKQVESYKNTKPQSAIQSRMQNLEKLILTIKMTKQQYANFMRQLDNQ